MVFSSVAFLLYFLPLFLLLYYLAPRPLKNAVLLVCSVLFYAWGAPRFILVILGTTLLDFFLVNRMNDSENETERKIMLTISVLVNIGLLFLFKYSNFFVENINILLKTLHIHHIKWAKMALPIGISFYTFETLTYVIDVYRRVHKPLKNFWDYQLYIILFPKLIAGPITRYHEISDQISNRDEYDTIDYKLIGFQRFCIGLGKKVLIANAMGAQADAIFNTDISTLDTQMAWVGSIAYTMQIYFDFSGYSDMAIGICQMVGFRLPENFNSPYTAVSISDFWRRWHITLGSWMRNYLYIPLGGNRVTNKWRLYFNLWLVFLASGFWHGASWSFIFWGAYHGSFLVLERTVWGRFLEKIGKFPSMLVTFLIVNIGWVFFRMEKIKDAFKFIKQMFNFKVKNIYFFANLDFYPILFIALFFAFFAATNWGEKIQERLFMVRERSAGLHGLLLFFSLLIFAISLASISSASFNPFIYFRF